MPVTLDCAAALGPTGKLEPVWTVRCYGDCFNRLNLFAPDAAAAASRAVAEYGWQGDENDIRCRTHRDG